MKTKIALIQQNSLGDKAANLQKQLIAIKEAAHQGANIVCLQELFLTDYFCNVQDVDNFNLADPIPGMTTNVLCQTADDNNVVLIASLFEKRGAGIYHNTTVVIDENGQLLGKYRKMHIPQDPGFEEKFYFTPGDTGYKSWDTSFGKIGVLICWDQWYPEAARLTALSGAQILFYPTAIGWLPEEKDKLGKAQHTAWETVQRGHAVANGCFVAAVNRVGTENDTQFWGQSFVANPYGEIIAKASESNEEILLCEIELNESEDFRRIWPFFRDRRIDSYQDISKRWID